jgi:hypothetical protein
MGPSRPNGTSTSGPPPHSGRIQPSTPPLALAPPPPLPPPPPAAAKRRGFFARVGGFFKKAGQRIGDAGRSLFNGVVHTAVGVGRNLIENAKRIGGGFARIFKGQIGAGFKDIGVGILDVTLGTVFDAGLMVLGKTVSAIQTLLGIEPPGRKLTEEEKQAAREVFGDSIDLDKVRVKEGGAGLFDIGGASAFVHGNTVYVAADNASTSLLIHELTHVWQHQNGGTDYMREALWSQNWGHGYDWEVSVPATAWADLEPEQQAEFIETAFRAGYFDVNDPNYGTFKVGGTDYTSYLTEALEELRAGRGAP